LTAKGSALPAELIEPIRVRAWPRNRFPADDVTITDRGFEQPQGEALAV
jgi:hypothetical protein